MHIVYIAQIQPPIHYTLLLYNSDIYVLKSYIEVRRRERMEMLEKVRAIHNHHGLPQNETKDSIDTTLS